MLAVGRILHRQCEALDQLAFRRILNTLKNLTEGTRPGIVLFLLENSNHVWLCLDSIFTWRLNQTISLRCTGYLSSDAIHRIKECYSKSIYFTYASLDEDRMSSLSLSKWRVLPSTRLPYSTPTLRSTWTRKQMTSAAKRTGAFYCEVDAEPLERYRKGGYHPTHLGDTFKDGRYKIIHKLGWGGYATVWLARDFMWAYTDAIHMRKVLQNGIS